MQNPHELKGYYETLIKNYKKLHKYLESSKAKNASSSEIENMQRNLNIIGDKISEFNRLYGAYIRKRRNSFGKFNIESFIGHLYGKNKEKRCKLERIYDNVESNLNIDLNTERSDESHGYEGGAERSTDFYNPGNFFIDKESRNGVDCGRRGHGKEIGEYIGHGKSPYYGGFFNEYYAPGDYNGTHAPSVYDMNSIYNGRRPENPACRTIPMGSYMEGLDGKNSQYLTPSMFHTDDDASTKKGADPNYGTQHYKGSTGGKQYLAEENFSALDSGTIFRNPSEREEYNKETVNRLEGILGTVKLKEETKMYIKEMCDVIIENICNTSCMIAKNACKEFLEEEDIKLAFKMEYNVEFPDIVKKYSAAENDLDHEKKMSSIEKEKKRKSKI